MGIRELYTGDLLDQAFDRLQLMRAKEKPYGKNIREVESLNQASGRVYIQDGNLMLEHE